MREIIIWSLAEFVGLLTYNETVSNFYESINLMKGNK